MKHIYLPLIILSGFILSACTSSGGYSPYTDSGYEEDYEEPPITSDNWNCTSDCSGHEAGYEWAADNGISDPSDCGGNSDSFIEGCEAYANEYLQEQEEELEYEYDQEYPY